MFSLQYQYFHLRKFSWHRNIVDKYMQIVADWFSNPSESNKWMFWNLWSVLGYFLCAIAFVRGIKNSDRLIFWHSQHPSVIPPLKLHAFKFFCLFFFNFKNYWLATASTWPFLLLIVIYPFDWVYLLSLSVSPV